MLWDAIKYIPQYLVHRFYSPTDGDADIACWIIIDPLFALQVPALNYKE